MSIINKLDSDTINKIAAGEVIERPAAVVKELVENAIDAKSNSITIEIKDGGITFIRITDNGCGIADDDIIPAFTRHSTSKIKNATDLITVMSLGFRGEALSSVASVAQVELITKTPDSLLGIRYVIEGGEEKTKEEIGCPVGTTFIVRNLFYNTPVRRKFLKSPQTEAGYISSVVEKIACSHPEISFKFIVNAQVKIHTLGNSNLNDIIYTLYGRDIAKNVIKVDSSLGKMSMTGLVAKPVVSRGNRNYEIIFINKRSIKSNIISKAIEDAYKSFMMQHKYPFVVLSITIDPELIDVNVHPAKLEIRFTNTNELYSFVYNSVYDALCGKNLIQAVSIDKESSKSESHVQSKPEKKTSVPEPFEINRVKEMIDTIIPPFETKPFETSQIKHKSDEDTSDELTPIDLIDDKDSSTDTVIATDEEPKAAKPSIIASPLPEYTAPKQQSLFDSEEFVKGNKVVNFKIIGQIFLTYWIVECNDKMYIIDQHAAHEKVLFEKTMAQVKSENVISQMISPPIIISLNMEQENAVNENIESFKKLGYEIDNFGGNEYSVNAVPANLPGIANTELLIEMIDELVHCDKGNTSDLILDKIASLSCKAAIKGNNRISMEEARKLIEDLMNLDNPFNCPHGRPTIISMSKYEIERKFKRII